MYTLSNCILRRDAVSGIAAALLLLAANACADPPTTLPGRYMFRSYGADQGLSNIAVLQLAQDREGFIWVGTDDGLYRYDGYHFDGYGLSEGLLSTSIDALHVDAEGTLWAGTHAGLSHWNGHSFDPVTPAQGLPRTSVTSIADGSEGPWVATAQGAFARAHAGQFAVVPAWPGGEATALWRDPRSTRMWVAQWNGEAHVLTFDGDVVAEVAGPPGRRKERVDVLAQDGQGRLWARSANELWVLQPGATAFAAAVTPMPLASRRGYMTVSPHGDLTVSSDAAIQRLSGDLWTVLGPKQGLANPPRPTLEDREGSLWVGTMGLHRLLGRGIFTSYTKAEGLPNDVVWSIFRDLEQQLWVGTAYGVALQTDDGFQTVPGTEANTVRNIVQGADGRLYMAGEPGNEILIYDPVSKVITRQELFPTNDSRRIFRLLLDREGILWASTDGAGLFSADTLANKLQFARVELPGETPLEYLSDIRQDAVGRIWVAGRNGLAMRENGVWRRFTTRDGLRRDHVAYVRPTRDGKLFVAYFEPLGVAQVRYDNGRFEVLGHLDSKTTYSADKVFMVSQDSEQRTWIGGGKGVDLITPTGTEHFGAREGLVGEDVCAMSFLADSNGDVWIGTTQGMVHFEAAAYRALPPSKPPAVSFITLRLGTQLYETGRPDIEVPYRANTFEARFAGISFASEDSVQYRERLLGRESDFHVANSHDARYSALSQGHYRFEVSARSGEHGPWGPPAVFDFRVLPAWWETWWFRTLGALASVAVLLWFVRWRLRILQRHNRLLEDAVAARTGELTQANDCLSETNTLLQSEIDDRLAAEHTLQQRNADLDTLNHKLAGTQHQLLQSEKMASVGQLAAGVAHEINNPIGYVNSNLGILKRYMCDMYTVLDRYALLEQTLPLDHPDRIDLAALRARLELDYLRQDAPHLLQESEDGITRVSKIVRDLRDFSRLDEYEWQLTDLHQGLESTLSIVANEIKYKAELIREYGEIPRIECLPSQLNQVFLNLLINAAQAIPERGRITIRTGTDANGVWVQIADTGQGIGPTNLSRIFEPFFTTKPIGSGTGLGLSVSYGIVQTHGGTIDVVSELGVGTTFTVHLPVQGNKKGAPGDSKASSNLAERTTVG